MSVNVGSGTVQVDGGLTKAMNTVIHDPSKAAKDAVKGARTWFDDFIKFISRGNVIDMSAFTAIVNSIVNDLLSPLIGAAIGINLADANSVLRPGLSGSWVYPTPDQAKADKAVTVAWGNFVQTLINFCFISIFCFFLIKLMGAFYHKKEEIHPTCPYCKEELKTDAIRCGHCTMPLPEPAEEKDVA